MKITAQMLRGGGDHAKRACAEQIAIFEREWPNGVEVNEANVLRAFAIGLDVGWFVETLLSLPSLVAFRQAEFLAQAAYRIALASTPVAYNQYETPSWQAYERDWAQALVAAIENEGQGALAMPYLL